MNGWARSANKRCTRVCRGGSGRRDYSGRGRSCFLAGRNRRRSGAVGLGGYPVHGFAGRSVCHFQRDAGRTGGTGPCKAAVPRAKRARHDFGRSIYLTSHRGRFRPAGRVRAKRMGQSCLRVDWPATGADLWFVWRCPGACVLQFAVGNTVDPARVGRCPRRTISAGRAAWVWVC